MHRVRPEHRPVRRNVEVDPASAKLRGATTIARRPFPCRGWRGEALEPGCRCRSVPSPRSSRRVPGEKYANDSREARGDQAERAVPERRRDAVRATGRFSDAIAPILDGLSSHRKDLGPRNAEAGPLSACGNHRVHLPVVSPRATTATAPASPGGQFARRRIGSWHQHRTARAHHRPHGPSRTPHLPQHHAPTNAWGSMH